MAEDPARTAEALRIVQERRKQQIMDEIGLLYRGILMRAYKQWHDLTKATHATNSALLLKNSASIAVAFIVGVHGDLDRLGKEVGAPIPPEARMPAKDTILHNLRLAAAFGYLFMGDGSPMELIAKELGTTRDYEDIEKFVASAKRAGGWRWKGGDRVVPLRSGDREQAIAFEKAWQNAYPELVGVVPDVF